MLYSHIINMHIYIYTCRIHHHHHHHVVLVARISLTLSRYFSLSPQAGLLDNILYPHIVAKCMFVLVVLLLPGHVWGPQEYITYELVTASPAVSCMSGSSSLNSFRDRRQVVVQLVFCGVLPPELVQDCSQNSCVIAV